MNPELHGTIRNGPDAAVPCYSVTLTLYDTVTINVIQVKPPHIHASSMAECDQQNNVFVVLFT